MRYPFDKFKLGTGYGVAGSCWRCGWHTGQDFSSVAAGGDGLVYPLYRGEVARITGRSSYGNCVYVRHADGYLTLYAHLKAVYVRVGMEVDEKTVLGVEGESGNASGRHLHIEVHEGQYHYPAAIDPLEFIKERLEVMKQIKILLNGAEKSVTAIEKNGNYYVRLQDLRDGKISVGYDGVKRVPVVSVG